MEPPPITPPHFHLSASTVHTPAYPDAACGGQRGVLLSGQAAGGTERQARAVGGRRFTVPPVKYVMQAGGGAVHPGCHPVEEGRGKCETRPTPPWPTQKNAKRLAHFDARVSREDAILSPALASSSRPDVSETAGWRGGSGGGGGMSEEASGRPASPSQQGSCKQLSQPWREEVYGSLSSIRVLHTHTLCVCAPLITFRWQPYTCTPTHAPPHACIQCQTSQGHSSPRTFTMAHVPLAPAPRPTSTTDSPRAASKLSSILMKVKPEGVRWWPPRPTRFTGLTCDNGPSTPAGGGPAAPEAGEPDSPPPLGAEEDPPPGAFPGPRCCRPPAAPPLSRPGIPIPAA